MLASVQVGPLRQVIEICAEHLDHQSDIGLFNKLVNNQLIKRNSEVIIANTFEKIEHYFVQFQ